jgi:hypothetical protein
MDFNGFHAWPLTNSNVYKKWPTWFPATKKIACGVLRLHLHAAAATPGGVHLLDVQLGQRRPDPGTESKSQEKELYIMIIMPNNNT